MINWKEWIPANRKLKLTVHLKIFKLTLTISKDRQHQDKYKASNIAEQTLLIANKVDKPIENRVKMCWIQGNSSTRSVIYQKNQP